MQRQGVLTVLPNALSVVGKNLGIILFISIIAGGLGDTLSFVLGNWGTEQILQHVDLPADPGARKQVTSIAYALGQVVVATLWYGPVGAWAAAATIYLWVRREKGEPASLYDAVNFGLNRLRRVLVPHWKAFFYIQLGNIIIVAAILLGLQYAFVDAIATLDDREPDPLARSRKLTLGRRGTIFRAFLPFTLWWIPYMVAVTFVLGQAGILVQFGTGIVNQVVLCTIDLVMVQLYLDLFRKPAADPAAPAPA